MNEGWATYWHHKILNSLQLPQALHLEFLAHHNQILQPHPGGINPYYLGFKLWQDIVQRHDKPVPNEAQTHGQQDKMGHEVIIGVRQVDRDTSFLRRFLTKELMRKMDLYEHEPKGKHRVASRISDENNWHHGQTDADPQRRHGYHSRD